MVLLAIGLFAAVGFTMMQGSRTSTSIVTDEQAKIYANQVISYGNQLKAAVKRLLLRGCKDTEISFANTVATGYTNTNNPPDSCKVFHVKGGGLNWWYSQDVRALESEVTPAGGYRNYYKEENYKHLFRFPVYNDTYDNGTPSGQSQAVDLIAVALFLNENVCKQINRQLTGSDVIPNGLPGFANFGSKFIGTYTPYASPFTPGKTTSICLSLSNGGLTHYFYYQLLIGR